MGTLSLGKAIGRAGLKDLRGLSTLFVVVVGIPVFRSLLWADSADFLRFRFFLERQHAAYTAGVQVHRAMGWLKGLGMSQALREVGISIFDCLLNVLRYFSSLWIQWSRLGNADHDGLSNMWIIAHPECMDNFRGVFLGLKLSLVVPLLVLGYLHGRFSQTHASVLETKKMVNIFSGSKAKAAPKVQQVVDDDDDDDDDSPRGGRVKSGKGGSRRSRSRGAKAK